MSTQVHSTLSEETVREISSDLGEPEWLLETRLDALSALDDIDMREWIVLGVFAIGVLWIGVYPKPLTDLMDPSIAQLAGQLSASKL